MLKSERCRRSPGKERRTGAQENKVSSGGLFHSLGSLRDKKKKKETVFFCCIMSYQERGLCINKDPPKEKKHLGMGL